MVGSVAKVHDEHRYVSYCKEDLAIACEDPLFSAPHLQDFLEYLSESSSQWPRGPYTEDESFAWSYTIPATGALQLSPQTRSKDFESVRKASEEFRDPELLFINGHPSPGWLNAIGYKYNVDMHFFQQHLSSIRPSIHDDVYAEPSLPSSSRHILKLKIPTVGYLEDVGNLLEDMPNARLLLVESLRQQVLRNAQNHPVGRPIVRSVYLHDLERFTLLQEVSICLLLRNDVWTVLVWTDAGGDDKDPDLSYLFEEAFQKPDIVRKICPTVFVRPRRHSQPASSSGVSSTVRFKSTQVFNSLHKVYGTTLDPKMMGLDPFYAISEVYSFAAAAESQFVNMMRTILDKRIKSIAGEDLQRKASISDALPERINLQHDRAILDAHSDRISNTVSFLRTADDPVWFRPFNDHAPNEATTTRITLLRDFEHLHTQVVQLIQLCERAMDMVAENASLLEAKRSNLQSEGIEKLTRLTTVITLLYVPLSFVCTFFGMNFSAFGQGDLSLWIWAAVSAPVLLISLLFLKRKASSESAKKKPSKKWYEWIKRQR